MLNITYDNIIFNLQKAGGISVVWTELIKRAINDPYLACQFIEYKNKNIFRNNINIPSLKEDVSRLPIKIERYLNPYIEENSGVFHSSYYRVNKNEKIKNVTTVHDFTYEYFRSGISKQIHVLQKSFAIRNSDGLICISENTKRDLMKFNPTIDEKKIKVIYNGVNDDYKVLDDLTKRKIIEHIDFENDSYVVFVGDRKSAYKNFRLVVNSIERTEFNLVIVGGGVLTKSDKEFLNVKLLGRHKHLNGISNSTLNLIYNNAFCLLYPSSYEGFGIPIIEAQKAGCLVISSSLSSIPEVMGNGGHKLDDLSVNVLREALLFYVNHNSERLKIIELGKYNARKYSWDKNYRETVEFYKKIISS